jgi:hypothetical protein
MVIAGESAEATASAYRIDGDAVRDAVEFFAGLRAIAA